jgi:hypothetical protein
VEQTSEETTAEVVAVALEDSERLLEHLGLIALLKHH